MDRKNETGRRALKRFFEQWHDLAARKGGAGRSVPAFLLLAAFALLFAFAGAGPAASGFQGRPEQKLDGREGQFRPFVVSRQDAGRIAHAPRPTSKPALASGGADGLSAAFLAVLAPGYSPRPTPVLAAAALSFRLYPSARPRAPPAFSLSC